MTSSPASEKMAVDEQRFEADAETLIEYTAQIRRLTVWGAVFTAVNVVFAAVLVFAE
jgi:hypothetical protein